MPLAGPAAVAFRCPLQQQALQALPLSKSIERRGEGSGAKTDLPQAEEASIQKVAQSTLASHRPAQCKRDARSQVAHY